MFNILNNKLNKFKLVLNGDLNQAESSQKLLKIQNQWINNMINNNNKK